MADPTSFQGGWGSTAYSDGVPAFLSHAGTVAAEIARAHPKTHLTFGLIDFFAPLVFDDGEGSTYHADITTFVNSSTFTAQVNTTILETSLWKQYYSLNDSDASDNVLQSSSIDALYGAMSGGNLQWSPNAHHVIVYLGSAAPLDRNYSINDCVFYNHSRCTLGPCSPAYRWTNGSVSPRCESWVGRSPLGANGSIGEMAYHASNCVHSLGGWCTIDALSYHDMVTDPQSRAWPTGTKVGGPGGSGVRHDTARIVGAACAIARATGGSWDGPTTAHCRGGSNGTLPFVAQFNGSSIQFDNPALVSAIGNISLGAPAGLPHAPAAPSPTYATVAGRGTSDLLTLGSTNSVRAASPAGPALPGLVGTPVAATAAESTPFRAKVKYAAP
ncbi:MAG TPA: hypothetical protein VFF67_00400 [Thermoplasmata archaeon]|nr:hypothetical protein [Thermoplasmata archaeon]